jgi:hypothetical protein
MTEKDAIKLIDALKNCLQKPITIPQLGSRQTYEAVEKENERQKFEIHMHRGSRDTQKISFHAMDKSTKTPLLRLDVCSDNNCHQNSDGSKIYGTHLHVFKDGLEIHDAIKFDINDDNLTNCCLEFFNKFNIINVERNNIIEYGPLLN